jgi:hypothetical protein
MPSGGARKRIGDRDPWRVPAASTQRVTEAAGSRGSLCGMSNPEVVRLARRVDEQDETIRAISDTVLDIKETVDQHTEELASIRQSQEEHTQALSQHTELLNEILRRLDAR